MTTVARDSGSDAAGAPPLLLPLIASTTTAPLLLSMASWLDGAAGRQVIMLFVFAVPFGLLHIVLLGLPYSIWLRRIDRFEFWPTVAGGFLLGAIPLGLLLGFDAMAMSVTGGLGAASAAAFFLVFRWQARLTRG